jgi:hypothetical protein
VLTSLGRWFAPWHRARGLKYLHYLLLVVLLNGAILAQRAGVITALQQGFLSERSSCQSFWPVPSGCLFHIHNSMYTVQSGFAGDDGLLGGEAPVADLDYMLGYAVQDNVYLPGGSWNHYTYLGAVYIYGSGWAERFVTPWGSHFAFLHIAAIYINGSAAHGGQLVGLSGWPSSLQYSNGSCWDTVSCRSDAHLCLILSNGARNWFFWIAAGRDVAPKRVHHPRPFPVHRWNSYAVRHHHAVQPYRSRGRLTHLAWSWFHDKGLAQKAGVPKRHEQWDARNRVMKAPFTKGTFYHWPTKHGDPVRFIHTKGR